MFRRFALGLIDLYRKGISPLTPPSCRFVPSCSTYAYQAIERFGIVRGGWLFLRRFARCHPFGGKGYDPVPPGSADTARIGGDSLPAEGRGIR